MMNVFNAAPTEEFFGFLSFFFLHRESFLLSRTRENFRKLASATNCTAEDRPSVHDSRSRRIPSFVGSALSQPREVLAVCRREGGKVRSSREYSSFSSLILSSIFFLSFSLNRMMKAVKTVHTVSICSASSQISL